ncbi:Neprosin [Arabidopsis suecica]|uniref:Neprosin n=1 Tax=Arabidopsis suecica TaxID=45249 RepID=A0A8T1ZBM7_ARASU|nr:Neprosin [Arabidopsis suecica]
MNLLPFLFSPALIRSDPNMVPLRTFKIRENVTYDCINIYKQPGLEHPLLQNHKIQMKPSVARHELKNQTDNTKTYKNKMGCPHGTVPILRNSKEYITNAQLFAEKYVYPLSGDSPGTHIAGVKSQNGPYHGVEASFSIHNINIERDQASYAQLYVGSGLNNQVNFIQAGWMGENGKGCYNTACPGFVQVSQEVPIAQPLDQPHEHLLHYSIHQDKQTGNWWITKLILNAPNIDVGYWPKELFNLIGTGANMVGVGGAVQASHQGSSPPMGNGKFPTGDRKESAMFTNIEVLNSNYEQRRIDSFPMEKLLDSPKCYGIRTDKVKLLDFTFNYGGPGGNSCGV